MQKAHFQRFVDTTGIVVEAKLQTHVEVDLNAIQNNALEIKAWTGKQLIAVVKADAYGHGAIPVSKALHTIADMFAVATVQEGIELREAGIQNPILILFSPLPELATEIVANNLIPAIDNWDLAQRLNQEKVKHSKHNSNERIKIHIDVNTGMNRCGVHYSQVSKFLKELRELQDLKVAGIFTHFATADEEDKSFAHIQIERFASILPNISDIPMKHVANSAAVLAITESHFDAVRPGLSLYGIYPANEKPIQLQPALTWKAPVGWVGSIASGEGVSYGLTYTPSDRKRVAGIQIGYGDGYPRSLSNIGEVLIGGLRRPIVGRVCMDMIVVGLETSDKVSVSDEVVLIGKQGNEEITINEIAEKANTISYEILTNIGKRVKRIYS